MTPKEPRSESLLAARIARAYPSLSAYSAATLAEALCAIERAQRRHAERCCSGADGGYVKYRIAQGCDETGRPVGMLRGDVEHDPEAEARAGRRVAQSVVDWHCRLHTLISGPHAPLVINALPPVELKGDPRGPVMRLRLPGETEAIAV